MERADIMIGQGALILSSLVLLICWGLRIATVLYVCRKVERSFTFKTGHLDIFGTLPNFRSE